jgi:hypothetical protein
VGQGLRQGRADKARSWCREGVCLDGWVAQVKGDTSCGAMHAPVWQRMRLLVQGRLCNTAGCCHWPAATRPCLAAHAMHTDCRHGLLTDRMYFCCADTCSCAARACAAMVAGSRRLISCRARSRSAGDMLFICC